MTPGDGVPDARTARWADLHHGLDPSTVPFVRHWLLTVWRLAGPLRSVPPTVITAAGVVAAAGALWSAGPVPVVALVLVVVSVLCDALDGAVAVIAHRATRSGAVADAVADRVCDALFAAVLWRCGVPWWAAVVAGVLAVGVDLARRALRVPTAVTVAERPTFAICAALACACAAVTSARWPVSVCAAVWIVAGVVGLAQVARAALRRGGPSTASSRPAGPAAKRP